MIWRCKACGATQERNTIRCEQCGKPLVFPASFTCPRCKAVSYNLNDIINRYCGRCHVFLDDERDRIADQERAEARRDPRQSSLL